MKINWSKIWDISAPFIVGAVIVALYLLFCCSCAVSKKPTTNLYRHELRQQRYYECIQTIPYNYKAHEKSGV